MMGRRKNVAPVLAMLLLFIIAAAVCIAALAMYGASETEKQEMSGVIDSLSAELALRTMADEQRVLRAEEKAVALLNDRQQRESLKESFLQRDREELALQVNPWNPLPEEYAARLVPLGDNIFMDERAAGALCAMLADCWKAGIQAVPLSGYRSYDYQQDLFDKKIENLLREGYSPDTVAATAAQSVAIPGTSEHHLGFAMDIADNDNPNLDITQSWTPTQRWLSAHCTDYGFILRYPEGTTETTGIIYEPWHYRYVGVTAAKAIEASGLVYEDYVKTYGGVSVP